MGSCRLLFAGTSRRAPKRPLPPGARPRRFECCESNVGFVTFRWRCGQFLKGQPQAAAQTWPRPSPPPAPGGPGPREADRAWASRGRRRRRTKRGPRQEPDCPQTRGGERSTLFRRAGALKGSRLDPRPLAQLEREQRNLRVAWRLKVSRGQSPLLPISASLETSDPLPWDWGL